MRWSEKHRPCNFDDVAGHEEMLLQIQGFIQSGDIPHLLFHGPPGIGKTTIAEIIAQELLGEYLDDEFIQMNASDSRGIDDIRKIVLNALRHKSYYTDLKVMLLDEADGLTSDAQDILRRPMEKSKNALFVLCCNDVEKISKAIQSRCAIYEFTAPPIGDTVKRLVQVCDAENKDIPESTLTEIAINAEGDVRHALNELQKIVACGPDSEIDRIMQKYTQEVPI